MVGILLSYWGGLFSGATLVSGRVTPPLFHKEKHQLHQSQKRQHCQGKALGLDQLQEMIRPNPKRMIPDGIWVFPKIGVVPQNGWFIKGSLVEKLPSYGDLKMQRVQYSNSSSSSAK